VVDDKREGRTTARRPVEPDLARTENTAPEWAVDHGIQRHHLRAETVIGRASECDIVVDSHLVSRKHAKLTVTGMGVFVEDLGSVNGVRVDSVTVTTRTLLSPGARINVADVQLVLVRVDGERKSRITAHTPTQSGFEVQIDEITRRSHAFRLLAGVVDKALALGQPDEAERLLGGLLQDLLREAQSGKEEVPSEMAESAARSAVKLGTGTGKASWVEYPFRLYAALGRVLPADVVDGLYDLVRKTPKVDLALLLRYAALLEGRPLSPAERFVVQRIQSLARMAAATGR
jgi:pSer/pThr/pTyr-binding forkhead associated (FHA) protein